MFSQSWKKKVFDIFFNTSACWSQFYCNKNNMLANHHCNSKRLVFKKVMNNYSNHSVIEAQVLIIYFSLNSFRVNVAQSLSSARSRVRYSHKKTSPYYYSKKDEGNCGSVINKLQLMNATISYFTTLKKQIRHTCDALLTILIKFIVLQSFLYHIAWQLDQSRDRACVFLW